MAAGGGPMAERNTTSRPPNKALAANLAALALCLVAASARLALAQSTPPPAEPPSQAPPAPSAAQVPGRRVLLLFGDPRLTPAVVAVDSIIRSTLEAQSPVPVSFYTEFLDLSLFQGSVPLPELRELLRRKYESRPLDLIVAGGSPSLRIALHNHAALFSNAPVWFVAVDRAAASDLSLDTDVTGTWLHQGWAGTLDLARRLQPDLHRVVVVTGSSSVDRVWREEARKQLAATGSVEVT